MVHESQELMILTYLKEFGFTLIQTPKLEALKEVQCLRFMRNNHQIEIAVKEYFETSTTIHLNYRFVAVLITASNFSLAFSELKNIDIER